MGKQIKSTDLGFTDLGFDIYLISPHFLDCVTLDLWSVQISEVSEFDNRVLNMKIDFLINASKLFVTNNSLAHYFRQQRPNTLPRK